MIKYILISLVLFSQIEGQQITHTELNKYGGINFISYFKMVDRGVGIKLFKKVKYYYDGTKYSETNYNGETNNSKVKDGLMTYWYENGQKKEERTYKDNNENGKWTEWYENGQKKSERNFVVGENGGYQSGLMTEWYENGQKRGEYNYKYGRRMSGTDWNEDGTVKN